MTDLTWLLILAAACVLVLLVGALLAVAASRTPTNASRQAKTAARPAPDGDEGEPLEPARVVPPATWSDGSPVFLGGAGATRDETNLSEQARAYLAELRGPHGDQADDRDTPVEPQSEAAKLDEYPDWMRRLPVQRSGDQP